MLSGFHTTANRSKSTFQLCKSHNNSSDYKQQQKLLPYQRREQLKNLLIVKFMKKYGFKTPEDFLEEEISKFVVSEKLSEKDLRKLDQRIKSIYEERRIQKSIQYGLSTKNKNSVYKNEFRNLNTEQSQKDNISAYSKRSSASRYSNLSQRPQSSQAKPGPKLVLQTKRPDSIDQKIGDGCYNIKPNALILTGSQELREAGNVKTEENNYPEEKEFMTEEPQEENPYIANCDARSQDSNEDRKERFEFPGGDEWNAIVEYNHKKYEEDMRNNKIKELEIRKRQKDDLDLQIREKLLKQQQEKILSRQYDDMQDKHLVEMHEIEKQREQENREKSYNLKYSRDVLLNNEKERKKWVVHQEKLLDRETGNFIKIKFIVKKVKQEIERNNRDVVKKKQLEKDAVQLLISDHEFSKQKAKEAVEQEKMNDIKITSEYSKMIDRQDNERNNFFKNKMRMPNEVTRQLVEDVLKDMEEKRRLEEERILQYNKNKEKKYHKTYYIEKKKWMRQRK